MTSPTQDITIIVFAHFRRKRSVMIRSICMCFLVAALPSFWGYELNILHINDAHSHIDGTSRQSGLCRESSSCYGGFARIVSKVNQIKSSTPNTIFLNAGDMFQGTPYFTKFKSDVLVDFTNQMGFDAQALGNHEFDEGVPELARYLSRLSTPVVCCNIDLSEEPSLRAQVLSDDIILDVGGVKVGIVGYLTTDILPKNLGKVKILPETPALKKAAAELRKKGAKIVIGLGHSGYEPELDIAKQAEGLDVVVGGHSHTFLYSGSQNPPDFDQPKGPYPTMVTQPSGKKVPVVQAFQFAKYLGHLKLEFDSKFRLINATGNPILLRPEFPRDKKILELQEKWDQNMTEVCRVGGEFTEDVDGDRTICRFQECAMGIFVADALLDYATKKLNNSELVSFIHGGLIRSSIEKGKATVGEVSSILPFKDPAVIVRLNGSALRQALEFSVKDYSDIVGTPRFVQLSGMMVKFDLSKPPGSRLTRAVVQTKPGEFSALDDSASYVVVMSKFTLNGGDGYTFKSSSPNPVHQSESPIDEILLEYLKTRGPYQPRKPGNRVELVKK